MARFVHDGDQLPDEELGRLVDAVVDVPGLADELRNQLVVHELLGQQLVETRGDFVAQVEQRLRDDRDGMVGGLSSIADLLPVESAESDETNDDPEDAVSVTEPSLDLRAHAIREMEQWQLRESRSRARTVYAGIAALAVVTCAVTLWLLNTGPDYGVVEAGNGVTVTRGKLVVVSPSIALEPNDRITTEPGVETRITYRDGTSLLVRGDSTIAVVESTPVIGKSLQVEAGDVSANVAEQPVNRPLILRTPDARARVLGTEFDLRVRNGRTRLDVRDGRVELTRLADGVAVVVGAREFAVASAGGGKGFRPRSVEFPGVTWDEVEPAEAGLDVDVLDRFAKAVGGSGCVVRGGRLVHEWGDPTQRGRGSRVSDVLWSHLLLLAIEEKQLENLDEPVHRTVERLTTNGVPEHDRRGKDAEITWRQLANHVSGYGTTDHPGTAFHLDGAQTGLLADALVRNVSLEDPAGFDRNVLRAKLTGPMQCEHGPTIVGEPNGLLRIAPRDLARFGLLYLHEGRWRSRQLLDYGLAATAVSSPVSNRIFPSDGKPASILPGGERLGEPGPSEHAGSHSFGWWLNGVGRRGTRMWPSAPVDTVAALAGDVHEALVVIPSLDLVVAWTNAPSRDWEPGRDDPIDGLLVELVAAAKGRR